MSEVYEHHPLAREALDGLLSGVESLEARAQEGWPSFERSELAQGAGQAQVLSKLSELLGQNQPYMHPLYAAHMIKPPHPTAWAAWAMASWVNPNNQSREASEATTNMELEAIAKLRAMFGWSEAHGFGHLTTSGTAANLEALWVARELRPGQAIAISAAAHYNHERIASLLQVPVITLPIAGDQTICVPQALELMAREDIGTLVVTLGTTALGQVDPLHELIELAQAKGIRVHADAAYGGYYRLLASSAEPVIDPRPWRSLERADSITLDPHKHGLVPYGCGALLYRDKRALKVLSHHSPYTYQDSSKVHMGQLQLECSRAGAAAASLWAVLQVLPLEPEHGMGALLGACRRAATGWAHEVLASDQLRLYVWPALDILAFAPWPRDAKLSSAQISEASRALVERGADLGQVYLSLYHVPCELAQRRWPQLEVNSPTLTLVRACTMKPEHESWWPTLHARCEALAQELAQATLAS